ncbi:hypothetical protein V5O48_009798 [Marasmius crinis-equi]|uniref:GST N-terminal domain-containing protein n=1 Tax=Marasmius crinis-equi TaxID=585013 RepID=A0ABR3FA52_9AGAR
MDASKLIVFYDIASGPPFRTYAINPWRTRIALNAKQLHYRTEWVDITEIKTVRGQLGVPPTEKMPDGSDRYTLPIIHDQSKSEFIGDQFEIALYLDKEYPSSGVKLFPDSTSVDLARTVEEHTNSLFYQFFGLLTSGIPLNPETAAITKADFASRFGAKSWEDMGFEGEARIQKVEELRAAFESLAKLYRVNEDGTQGPFFEGRASPVYADLIVAGWMRVLQRSFREFEEVKTWHGGLWARIHSETEKFAQVK